MGRKGRFKKPDQFVYKEKDLSERNSTEDVVQEEITDIQMLRRVIGTGPFQMFMDALNYPGKSYSNSGEVIISSYLVWRKLSEEKKEEFKEKYYEELNRVVSTNTIPDDSKLSDVKLSIASVDEKIITSSSIMDNSTATPSIVKSIDYNSLAFKPWYMEMISGHKIERVKISPYFYWLGWYLKGNATPELLAKDSLSIALELGEKWNAMDRDAKQQWVDIVSNKLRHHPRRGSKDLQLPNWYLERFK